MVHTVHVMLLLLYSVPSNIYIYVATYIKLYHTRVVHVPLHHFRKKNES